MTLEAPLLGVVIDGPGQHPARRVGGTAGSDGSSSASSARPLADLVRLADDAGFDVLTFDGPSGPVGPSEPLHPPDPPGRSPQPQTPRRRADDIDRDDILQVASLAPLTRHAALLPTVRGTDALPFHICTFLDALDLSSGGRGGWLVGGVSDIGTLHDRAVEAAALIDTVRCLWAGSRDGTEPAADASAPADVAVPVATSARHRLPVVAVTVAAPDDPFIDVAAAHADLVVLEIADIDTAALLRRRIIRRAASLGRSSQSIRVVLAADVLVDHDEFTARRLRHALDRVVEPTRGVRPDVVGTPGQVAVFVARVHAAGLDGVFFRPARLPDDLLLLATHVVPLVPRAHPSVSTFRARLGLEHATVPDATEEVAS